MKKSSLYLSGSGSVTSTLSNIVTAYTPVETAVTIVTLPSTPGFEYEVALSPVAWATAGASSTAVNVTVVCAGTISGVSTYAANITSEAGVIWPGSNESTTVGTPAVIKIKGVAGQVITCSYWVAGPNNTDAFRGSYKVYYQYVGKKITEGTF